MCHSIGVARRKTKEIDMDQKALETMWRIILLQDLVRNNTELPEEIEETVEMAQIAVIDVRHAIIDIDGIAHLVIQENGFVIGSLEAGTCADKLFKKEIK